MHICRCAVRIFHGNISGRLVGVMTLNEIQEVIEGRINITDPLGAQAPTSPPHIPGNSAAGVLHSTFELDPTQMVHK